MKRVSLKLTAMNTPFGRYKFLRLPFGIHSAQEVFHRNINGRFMDIAGVETDIDDILIWSNNTEDHNRSLIASLERAKKIRLTMKLNKCKFNANELIYGGLKISARGIEPDETKIKAIMEMPEPSDNEGIQRLLGLINYVAKFLPKQSEVTWPLTELLQKDVHWHWEEDHKKSFENIKKLLSSNLCLAFYDVSKPTTIHMDASNSGLGAALLQEGKLVAHASRSLTTAVKNYAVIEKELLAVLFRCERFHQYVYENKILIESDRKPLESIMKRPLARATVRLQRMLLHLQKYDFQLS